MLRDATPSVRNAAPLTHSPTLTLSQVVVDETVLMEGKLTELGVSNLDALKGVVEHQKLQYDFKFYATDMPVDTPVLVLSDSPSLLPCAVTVPLHAVGAPPPPPLCTLPPPPLAVAVAALCLCPCLAVCELSFGGNINASA